LILIHVKKILKKFLKRNNISKIIKIIVEYSDIAGWLSFEFCKKAVLNGMNNAYIYKQKIKRVLNS
jgi:hypothetical protein